MELLNYPYVIITILASAFLLMCLIGLYFTIKSLKTAKGTVERNFCSIHKIENDFGRRKNRCVVYISVSLNNMQRLYSESKAIRIKEEIKGILLRNFCLNIGGEIALYGKENFVAFNNLEEKEIEICINKSNSEINEAFVKFGAVGVVSIHFGYNLTSSNEVSFKTILARAKQACSIAENKKILYCRWDNTLGKEFERKLNMENNIRDEIDNNRFFLEFQPVIEAKTEKIIGAEVLSRLNSKEEGILTPRDFLSAVHNVGLNQKFDYYIFEKNCKWISSDKENRMKYVYTINFSRYTLCDEKFAEKIIKVVEKYGIDYSCIAIEILEDKNLEGNERTSMIKNLAILKEKGMLILLDDFGKGYTSFGDLTDFDISIVKIDKSITQSTNSQIGFVVLKNIIRTAHDLGFKTVCEGVETEEQKNLAVKAGCDMLQGYYFYRPMAVAQFENLFEK